MVADWSGCPSEGTNEQEQALLRRHERTGRPLGSKRFVRKLEKTLGRVLRPQEAAAHGRAGKTSVVPLVPPVVLLIGHKLATLRLSDCGTHRSGARKDEISA